MYPCCVAVKPKSEQSKVSCETLLDKLPLNPFIPIQKTNNFISLIFCCQSCICVQVLNSIHVMLWRCKTQHEQTFIKLNSTSVLLRFLNSFLLIWINSMLRYSSLSFNAYGSQLSKQHTVHMHFIGQLGPKLTNKKLENTSTSCP